MKEAKKKNSLMNSFRKGLLKNFRSYGYAIKGLLFLIRTENNFRVQLVAALATLCLSFYLQISAGHWMVIIIMIGLVLSAEAFNTALEKLIDKLHPDHHELIGKVKDVSAAAVFIMALIAVAVGIFIFLPYISDLV